MRLRDFYVAAFAALLALPALAVPPSYPIVLPASGPIQYHVEAEHYFARTGATDTAVTPNVAHSWVPDFTLYPGPTGFYSGASALSALPDSGSNITAANAPANAPRLDYKFTFQQAGNYYVWVRMYAKGGGSDKLWIGMSPTVPAVPTAALMVPTDNAWTWVRSTAFLNTTAGATRYISLYMAEDGVAVDALVISNSSSAVSPTSITPAARYRASNDFNYDGSGDLVIRDDANGLHYAWLMSPTETSLLQISDGGYLLDAGSGWDIVRILDLDGDRKADILLQDADGSLYAWIMDRLTVYTGGYLLGARTGWNVSHTGDFNGDGRQDILLEHSDGSIYMWLMDGINVIGGTFLQGAATGWEPTHVADFNGDGKSDILLKHGDGSIYIWQMNGIAIEAGTFLKGRGIDWSPTATGDFNGDGKADILITHENGGVYLWQMNGVAIQTGAYLLSPGSGWSIAKVVRLNSAAGILDPIEDIILQHTDGSLYAWVMSSALVPTDGGWLLGPGTPWTLTHALDLNGDGRTDLLLRHTDGSIYAWLMGGPVIGGGGYLMGPGSWRVVP